MGQLFGAWKQNNANSVISLKPMQIDTPMTLPVIATDIILQSSDGVYALTAIHKQILPSPPRPPPKEKKNDND